MTQASGRPFVENIVGSRAIIIKAHWCAHYSPARQLVTTVTVIHKIGYNVKISDGHMAFSGFSLQIQKAAQSQMHKPFGSRGVKMGKWYICSSENTAVMAIIGQLHGLEEEGRVI